MAHVRKLHSESDPLFEIALNAAEEACLLSVPDLLERVLTDPTLSPKIVDRLFPPAFPGNLAEEAKHRRLLGTSMYETRRENLRTFKTLLQRSVPKLRRMRRVQVLHLMATDLRIIVHVINDLRILLGTQLNIVNNDWRQHLPDTPEETAAFLQFIRLGDIQSDLVQTLLDY
jgi:hypothetical protein